MKHIIVGVDPGKTSAIACLSLEGSLILSAHQVSAGMPWILDRIMEAGTPSIIATDRKVLGDTVRKINAAFRSKLFMPIKDISTMEKRELARRAGIKNPHERDAYAAAVKAYRAYANKLNQAEHISRDSGEPDSDMVKAKIIQKYSISEAIAGRKANR